MMILQVVCTHSEYFQLGALLGSRVSVTWCVEARVTCQHHVLQEEVGLCAGTRVVGLR